jgi:hypothetical protein
LLTPRAEDPTKTLKQNFQQLGQDLKSGNLSAAQSDFTALQQNVTASASAVPSPQAAASPSTGISQDFAKLSIDLQYGNLTGAQADYNSILQSFQTQAAQSQLLPDIIVVIIMQAAAKPAIRLPTPQAPAPLPPPLPVPLQIPPLSRLPN